jgi:hypothetical protein
MKLFVITTTSESSDHYSYVIKHPKQPTDKELKAFMIRHSCDKDKSKGVLYEYITEVIEVSEDQAETIPKIPKEELAKWYTVGEK